MPTEQFGVDDTVHGALHDLGELQGIGERNVDANDARQLHDEGASGLARHVLRLAALQHLLVAALEVVAVGDVVAVAFLPVVIGLQAPLQVNHERLVKGFLHPEVFLKEPN